MSAFYHAYLFSYLFCLGIALGGLSLLMLHNLTGGDWGTAIRPVARAASLSLPLLAVLFVPIVIGLPTLYPWADAHGGAEELLVHRRPYLNPTFFTIRAGVYFGVWIAVAFLLHAWQRRFEKGPTAAMATRIRALSAAGLILYLLTMTHAGVDWVMSRNTDFYSTAFGFILTVGQTLSALAFALIVVPPATSAPVQPVSKLRGVLNDTGNILLTLVILWAYVSFMEFLIIWMGNSREDNAWFLQRGLAGDAGMSFWRTVAAIVLLFHFFVPFYLLLFRDVKQNWRALRRVAWVLFAAHILEQYWLAGAPASGQGREFHGTWLDGVVFLIVLAVWLAVFFWIRRRMRPETLPEFATGEMAHD
ncbi:MAG TPA: hypothetical protein VHM90_01275 [Phycisphaerae bacterium]|nr:hypothetical protein [Phycisphaerae bacterium]